MTSEKPTLVPTWSGWISFQLFSEPDKYHSVDLNGNVKWKCRAEYVINHQNGQTASESDDGRDILFKSFTFLCESHNLCTQNEEQISENSTCIKQNSSGHYTWSREFISDVALNKIMKLQDFSEYFCLNSYLSFALPDLTIWLLL